MNEFDRNKRMRLLQCVSRIDLYQRNPLYIPFLIAWLGVFTHSLIVFTIFVLIGIASYFVITPRCRQVAKRATDEVLQFLKGADLHDLGLIFELNDMPGLPSSCRVLVHPVLMRVLSTIGEGAQVELTSKQRDDLRLLVIGADTALAEAVVNSFAFIGDGEDLATLHRIVSGTSHVRSPAVRSAAEAILPVLEERLQRARAGDTLLRASTVPDHDTLLRADIKPAEEQPGTLLRASGAHDHNTPLRSTIKPAEEHPETPRQVASRSSED